MIKGTAWAALVLASVLAGACGERSEQPQGPAIPAWRATQADSAVLARVLARVQEIGSHDVPQSGLTPATRLDSVLDALGRLDLTAALEEDFGIEIEYVDTEAWSTVNDVARYVTWARPAR